MAEGCRVELASGSLRDAVDATWSAAHPWTPEGVAVSGAFTGAHLLHAAVGGCVLNDLHREAGPLGVVLRGARSISTSRAARPPRCSPGWTR